jgi:hypothetical protein
VYGSTKNGSACAFSAIIVHAEIKESPPWSLHHHWTWATRIYAELPMTLISALTLSGTENFFLLKHNLFPGA